MKYSFQLFTEGTAVLVGPSSGIQQLLATGTSETSFLRVLTVADSTRLVKLLKKTILIVFDVSFHSFTFIYTSLT